MFLESAVLYMLSKDIHVGAPAAAYQLEFHGLRVIKV